MSFLLLVSLSCCWSDLICIIMGVCVCVCLGGRRGVVDVNVDSSSLASKKKREEGDGISAIYFFTLTHTYTVHQVFSVLLRIYRKSIISRFFFVVAKFRISKIFLFCHFSLRLNNLCIGVWVFISIHFPTIFWIFFPLNVFKCNGFRLFSKISLDITIFLVKFVVPVRKYVPTISNEFSEKKTMGKRERANHELSSMRIFSLFFFWNKFRKIVGIIFQLFAFIA